MCHHHTGRHLETGALTALLEPAPNSDRRSRPTRTSTLSPQLRVSDRDRDATAETLSQALALGYLDPEEFDHRTSRALTATNGVDLQALLADLPVDQLAPPTLATPRTGPVPEIRLHLALFLAATLLTLGLWLTLALSTNDWYPWPVWPILGGGTGLLMHTTIGRRACPTTKAVSP